MYTRIYRIICLILLNSIIFGGYAKEMKVEAFEEKVEDLTANTQPVLDFNNNKCALIKISIPEKAGFEGNIVKSEYKTNEFYIYVSPGTKKIVLKYPGRETLIIPLSDFLDGSGVVTARTYRLEVSGVPEEYVWKPNKFIIKAYADVGFGNAINMTSAIPLASSKASANNFGIDFGFNMIQNEKNSFNINVGIGYSPISLKLNTENMSFNYSAPSTADMDGNTYNRYYTLNNMNQEIKTAFFNVPIYLGYSYNIKRWLGVYVNLGATLGFKSSSKFKSVYGEGNVYGIYPEYGDLKIEDSYLNGFGRVNLSNADKAPLNMNSFSASMLFGAGVEGKISGPLWVNVGVKYNLGMTNIFKNTFKTGDKFTSDNAPVIYTVSGGENVNPLTNYLTKNKLSMFSLNVGLALKF